MKPAAPAIIRDREYGLVARPLRWVPTLRYLLRRDVVLRLLHGDHPGRVIEVGCGAGTLLADLDRMGWECSAVEASTDARALANRMLVDHPSIVVQESFDPSWENHFDLLMAFEVLEHIENDHAALRDWLTRIRPGGRVLLSMPAHPKRWTARDVWAGHFRRYSRDGMVNLAETCGVIVTQCINYGFPSANLIEVAGDFRYARDLKRQGLLGDGEALPSVAEADPGLRQARTSRSGTWREAETRLYPLMASLPGRIAFRTAAQIQRWFSRTELGNGFIVDGRKA